MITILFVLVAIGVILWFLRPYIDPPIMRGIYVVLVLVFLFWLMGQFGLVAAPHWGHLR